MGGVVISGGTKRIFISIRVREVLTTSKETVDLGDLSMAGGMIGDTAQGQGKTLRRDRATSPRGKSEDLRFHPECARPRDQLVLRFALKK
mmetsp:Transcript_745/g.1109  ORF Transcript_745/g.1109 Transcript_745/m.1109 type:complete len:90 (-) Transcript_745:608-877(-)